MNHQCKYKKIVQLNDCFANVAVVQKSNAFLRVFIFWIPIIWLGMFMIVLVISLEICYFKFTKNVECIQLIHHCILKKGDTLGRDKMNIEKHIHSSHQKQDTDLAAQLTDSFRNTKTMLEGTIADWSKSIPFTRQNSGQTDGQDKSDIRSVIWKEARLKRRSIAEIKALCGIGKETIPIRNDMNRFCRVEFTILNPDLMDEIKIWINFSLAVIYDMSLTVLSFLRLVKLGRYNETMMYPTVFPDSGYVFIQFSEQEFGKSNQIFFGESSKTTQPNNFLHPLISQDNNDFDHEVSLAAKCLHNQLKIEVRMLPNFFVTIGKKNESTSGDIKMDYNCPGFLTLSKHQKRDSFSSDGRQADLSSIFLDDYADDLILRSEHEDKPSNNGKYTIVNAFIDHG